MRPVIEAFFREGWKHKRIEKELERARKVNSAKQDRAREAANVRWSKAALHRSDWLYAQGDAAFAEAEDRLALADRLAQRARTHAY